MLLVLLTIAVFAVTIDVRPASARGSDVFHGPFQNETGSDGIGDTSYVIEANNKDQYPLIQPSSWTLPWGDWNHYHNYTEIVNTLLYLNNTYPSIVEVRSIGKSWQNKDIYCIKLTNRQITHQKPKVLFISYHHAREPITAELSLYFAVQAASDYYTNTTVARMLNYSEIYIVVALNADGFDIVKQNEWQRKNAHPFDEDMDGLLDEDPPDDEDHDGRIEDLFYSDGSTYCFIRWEGRDDDGDGRFNEDWVGGVDLNRNYGYQWNATCDTGSPNPRAEDFRGLAPFSEPETQAIRDLALQNDFKYAISFHSGAEVVLYPWGYTHSSTLHDSLFRGIATDISNLVEAPWEQSAQLYTSSGLWEDWMYGNRSTFSLTCEIYSNDSAWRYEPGPEPNTWWESGITQAFNPDPSQIKATIQRWLPVFTYVISRAITEAYDIAVTDIKTSYPIVRQGASLDVNVTVTNQGMFTETFNVTLYANTTIMTSQVVMLENDTSESITFTWNTSGFSLGNHAIWAYAEPVLGEEHISDNTRAYGALYISWRYDPTGDGYCGVDDIFEVAAHFATEPSDLGWNPIYDLGNDDFVGVDDIFEMAQHFGESSP